MIKWICATVVVVSISLIGCTDENSCTSGTIPTISLSDIGCNNAERLVKLNSSNELELIRSQDEFENLVIAPCALDIDWQQYDLVIGTVRLAQGYAGMKRTAVFDCVEDRMEMTVEITLSGTTDAPTVTWSFLIPKATDFFIRPLKFS